jgi:hypothetical protein
MEDEPSRAFLLLSNHVDNFNVIDHDPMAYRIVECSSKAAYGCGPNGDAIVRGLTLFVRVGSGDDDQYITPELLLRATDEVFRRVGSELDVEKAKRCGSHTRLSSCIYGVDGDVMVICISFIPTFMADEVSYYLVYDSAAASLSLLPRLPPCCRPVCTEFPLRVKVKVKAGEEDKKLYSLVLMAERSTSPSAKYTDPVLCLWSPPPPPDNDARQDYSRRAWELKARVRVNAMADTFEAHTVFSCNRHAVWGDLAQGILYCGLGDLTDDATEPVVFKHAMLPEECRIRLRHRRGPDARVPDHEPRRGRLHLVRPHRTVVRPPRRYEGEGVDSRRPPIGGVEHAEGVQDARLVRAGGVQGVGVAGDRATRVPVLEAAAEG